MRGEKLRCCAVGDSFLIDRPAHNDARMLSLRSLISDSDAAITNVEATLHCFEPDIYPARESGGDWAVANPDIVEELQWLGFNLLSAPNNHSLDYLHAGVMRTVRAFRDADVAFAGIGENLAQAEAPCYISTSNGRVAMIALNLTFERWHPAGEQRSDCNGRPGINYLQHQKIYGIDATEMDALLHMTELYPELVHRDGETVKLGDYSFELGEPGIRTVANPADLERLRRSISRARRQADYVLVSVHSHERRNGDARRAAEFEEAFAHSCVDCGADAYIGHGSHMIRGIEIYKNRPILYSLGNFFYQCELIERSPEEFYHKFKEFDRTASTADVFDYREGSGGILGETNPEYYRSMLVNFELTTGAGLTGLTVHPIDLNFDASRAQKGTPELADNVLADRVFSELIDRSEIYGTRFVRKEDRLEIEL